MSDLSNVVSLPRILRRWLSKHHYDVIQIHQVTGHFDAHIQDLFVRDKTGEIHRLMWKETPAGSMELDVCQKQQVLHLHPFQPRLYAILQSQDCSGILQEKFGNSLAVEWETAKKQENHLHTLIAFTTWLARMHSQLRSTVKTALAHQTMGFYREATAQTWRQSALFELAAAVELHLLAPDTLADLQQMTKVFSKYSEECTANERRSQGSSEYQRSLTITHGDCHIGNILLKPQDDNSFRLIDWEYTCVAQPQRDLTALLQCVTKDTDRRQIEQAYRQELQSQGWEVETRTYNLTFHRYLFDNTLMMLGWDLRHLRQDVSEKGVPRLTIQDEITQLIQHKVNWLQSSFNFLFHG